MCHGSLISPPNAAAIDSSSSAQSRLGAPERDVVDPELAQGADLEVELLQLARERQRPLVVALGLLRVGCPARALNLQLDLRRAGGETVEQPLGTVEPAVGDRRVPVHARLLDREPERDPTRPACVAGAAEAGVRLLALRHPRADLALEPEHLAEPVARVGILALREQALEQRPGVLPFALLERRPGRLAAGRRRASLHGREPTGGLILSSVR